MVKITHGKRTNQLVCLTIHISPANVVQDLF